MKPLSLISKRADIFCRDMHVAERAGWQAETRALMKARDAEIAAGTRPQKVLDLDVGYHQDLEAANKRLEMDNRLMAPRVCCFRDILVLLMRLGSSQTPSARLTVSLPSFDTFDLMSYSRHTLLAIQTMFCSRHEGIPRCARWWRGNRDRHRKWVPAMLYWVMLVRNTFCLLQERSELCVRWTIGWGA